MTDPTPSGGNGHVIFAFATSHHAFQAEDIAREREITVEVVPAPSRAKAKCGVALRVPANRASGLADAFQREGVRFDRFEDG